MQEGGSGMNKARVIVVGGGFSGIAAAIAANKAGAQATLLERTDMLSGAGLRAARLYHNLKIVGGEEAKALGGGEVFEALESILLHRGNIIDEVGAFIYNTVLVDTTMRKLVEASGVELHMESRAVEVEKENGALKAVTTHSGERFPGDAFVDASGTFGELSNCIQYGYGCVMCHNRCLFFGDRVSIATKAGAEELHWTRPDGKPGALGAGIALYKESLSAELRAILRKEGTCTIPIPEELIDYDRLKQISAARGPREVSHINLVDIGLSAKCVGIGNFRLANLRKIPGFENAQIEYPMGGGGSGNVANMSFTPRENSLRAKGFANIFIAGNKTGMGGIVESVFTGVLAGSNAARVAFGKQPIELPRSTAIGDMIAYRGERMATSGDLRVALSMAHGVYYERMKELGFDSSDPAVIHKRIDALGLTNILSQKLA